MSKSQFVKLWNFKHPTRDVTLQFLVIRESEDKGGTPYFIRAMTQNEFGTMGTCVLRYKSVESWRDAFFNYFTDETAEGFFLDLIAVTDKVTKKPAMASYPQEVMP